MNEHGHGINLNGCARFVGDNYERASMNSMRFVEGYTTEAALCKATVSKKPT